MRVLLVVLLLLGASAGPTLAAEPFDHGHSRWTALLQAHVRWNSDGHASSVDYAGFKRERAALGFYLDQLAAVSQADFDGWSNAQRTAFLINAYNAWTIELILTRYPNLTSIKELGRFFSSPWKQSIAPLLGSTRSLDEIEHGLLRGAKDFNEPRIHFAVNCASIGCPALRPEAYVAVGLDAQLADQTQRFLRDRSRNRYNFQRARLEISPLFDWYAADFTAADDTLPPPLGFLAQHAELLTDDPTALEQIRKGSAKFSFLDYDWALNHLPTSADR